MRQGLFNQKGAGFVACHGTPFVLADGSVSTLNRTRTRTGSANQGINSYVGDTKMAAKSKSTKSSGKSGAKGKGPANVSKPALAMANLKGKKGK